MKKIINNIYLMCSIVLLVVLGACSDEYKFMGGNDEIVVTAIMPDDGTTPSHGTLKGVAVSSDDNTLNLITKWKSGDKIQVFVRQDNKVYKVSEESAVYNISSDGKTCSFNFSLPSSIDGARVYDVIGVTGISAQASGSEVYATSTLKRMNLDSNGEATSPMWFITAKTNTATNFQAKFQHLGTYEILHVTNATSGDLTFRHLGFDVSEPWFKYNDNTALNNTYDPTASFTEPGDVESPPILIRAGKTGKILSWYMPSGSLMEGAKLLALINGKNVTSSNTKSSALPIQRGKAYHMYATWDGKQLKFDDNEHGAADVETQTFTVNGVSFTMVGVEGGTFMMGAADDDTEADSYERPSHQVTLSSFAIGQTEVTQELWQAVMGYNPSHFNGGSYDTDLSRPVEYVNLYECREFVARLSQLTSREFRLPTEEEWEYAARGGKHSLGHKYAGSNNLNEVAWYKNNSSERTHDVATKNANELGLYDMSGNVEEWCQNKWYNYDGSSYSGPCRAARGGDYLSHESNNRISCRNYPDGDYKDSYRGLRVVLSKENQNIFSCPDNNHPHAINMGLASGTKWACCNVGAIQPDIFGNLYAWGEVSPKDTYTKDNYIHKDESGFIDLGDCISGTEYDVAHLIWGSNWCMPTVDQMNELNKSCSKEWFIYNGTNGIKFTGPNGNMIFLPAAGEFDGDMVGWWSGRDESLHYWTGTTWFDSSYRKTWAYHFSAGNFTSSAVCGKWKGHSVRPVMN